MPRRTIGFSAMENFLVVGIIGFLSFLIWLVARARQSAPKLPISSTPSRSPLLAPKTFANNSGTVNADDCWVPPGRSVTVAGYLIPGGMLYIGTGLSSLSGVRIEPALIDPSLPVKRSDPDGSGSD